MLAGLNHFVDPGFYYPLIPSYLQAPQAINIIAGLAEVLLGLGLISPKTRKVAVFGIIAMLVAFIPSHVFFIEKGSCLQNSLCVAPWLGWLRILLVHPILILWAWWHRR